MKKNYKKLTKIIFLLQNSQNLKIFLTKFYKKMIKNFDFFSYDNDHSEKNINFFATKILKICNFFHKILQKNK